MILRKHDHSVLLSLCSIHQHLFDFLYFIICNLYSLKCVKLKKTKAEQEAFGERRHLHVCDLCNGIVTF